MSALHQEATTMSEIIIPIEIAPGTYWVGKRIIQVKWISMPNILADEEVLPEFIQDAATPENLSAAAIDLLQNQTRRGLVKSKLKQIIASLGEPGAAGRAAKFVADLL